MSSFHHSEGAQTRLVLGRRTFLTLGMAGFVGALAACAPANYMPSRPSGTATEQDAKPDGSIRAAISYELGNTGYDPMTTTAALTQAVNWHIFEGLIEIDPVDAKVYPALATGMPTLVESGAVSGEQGEGQPVKYRVTLRDGAVFHDGSPVTSTDVVFSFERVLDPENRSLYRTFISFITGVSAVDSRTVEFTLERPIGVFAERLSVVKIVPKAIVEAGVKKFDANPVGTGPFKLIENGGIAKNIAFVRFDDYTGPRPARVAKMNWQIIPDAATRTNAVQSGVVQAIDSVPYLSVDSLKNTATVDSIQGFGLLFSLFNNSPDSLFSQQDARQAFLYAIDMAKVIETGMNGQASAATSFLQETHPNYIRAKNVYSYDAEKAKELFARAGVKKIKLVCTDHDWVRKCTPLIRESLVGLGLQVDFEERKSSDLYKTIEASTSNFDVAIAPGDPSVFGPDPDLLMRWWYAGDAWTEGRMRWKGTDSYQRVQELLDAGLSARNPEERQRIWKETFDYLSEIVVLYPLFHRKTPSAWDASTLINFRPTSLTGFSFLDVASAK